MKLLFTVCGRAGSKGIKGKNFKEFLGYPLLYYTFAAIALYKERHPEHVLHVALNTDSEEMISLVRTGVDMEVLVVSRKAELAGDSVGKMAVIADTLHCVESNTGMEYDGVVDLDITSPLRTVKDIENLIQKFQSLEYEVVFSVAESRRNPYFNMVKEMEDGSVELVCPSQYTARQQAPAIYDMNASLYAYRPEFLRSHERIFDGKCSIIMMMDTAVLDLDHEKDFELMQVIAEHLFEKYDEFREIRDTVCRITVTAK